MMWVYRQWTNHSSDEPGSKNTYQVGFFGPDSGDPTLITWYKDSTHLTRDGAAARVHYLNGGPADRIQRVSVVEPRCAPAFSWGGVSNSSNRMGESDG